LLYLVFYLLVWVLLKSPTMAAQSVLYAMMESSLGRGAGGRLIKECMEVDCARKDVDDEEEAKKLWEASDKLIERVEKEQAVKRARAKKEQEKRDEEAKNAARVEEIESLIGSIKKGKAKEAKEAKEVPKKGGKKTKTAGNNVK